MLANRRASILIFTIWVLGILSVFAVYISNMVNQRILISARIQDNENLNLVAESGIKNALLQLKMNIYESSFTALPGYCTNNPSVFKDILLDSGGFIVSYENKGYDSGSNEIRYGFIDEERKINLNSAPDFVLRRLLQIVAGLEASSAEKISSAIIDYRDTDTVSKSGIPEDFAYKGQGNCWINNSNFQFLEEIKLVPGITNEIFQKIKPFVTVYGLGTVNINTVQGQILEILGLDKKLASKVISFRSGIDGGDGTGDDNKVENIADYIDTISKYVQLSEDELKGLEGLILSGLVSTRSSCVFIESFGSLKNKKKSAKIECVYDLGGKTKYWKETFIAD